MVTSLTKLCSHQGKQNGILSDADRWMTRKMKEIYVDYAATTPISESARNLFYIGRNQVMCSQRWGLPKSRQGAASVFLFRQTIQRKISTRYVVY